MRKLFLASMKFRIKRGTSLVDTEEIHHENRLVAVTYKNQKQQKEEPWDSAHELDLAYDKAHAYFDKELANCDLISLIVHPTIQ